MKQILEFVMDILETVVFMGSLFIVIYLFIVTPNQVKGASMEPSFHSGDFIFTSKVTYKLRTPHRGDVVVFQAPSNHDIEYIKRIIGLPGDTIMVKEGTVYVNGSALKENYIAAATSVWEGGFLKEAQPITVPADELFVMGDNRPHSSDSREFGPIPISTVIGQVFFRYYPANQMGTINNPMPKSLQSFILVPQNLLHQLA
ncbi:signal peptidase I [Candidatus Roizmanbacteria bacterium]|nr:signal peptidase I [Candidatus Roizmanbacteria bacterium]